MHAKLALFGTARGHGDLAAGCMGDGQGGPNLGEILRGRKLNFPFMERQLHIKGAFG